MPTTAYYAIALSMSQAVSLAVAFLAWRRRFVPGSVYFALMMVSAALWCAAAAIEAVSADLNTKVIWSQISYLGICAAPPLFLLFALHYWRPEIRIRLPYRICIWIIPVVTIIMAATNDLHYLLWSGFAFESPDSNILMYGHGVWFWINVAYSYTLMLVSIFVLSRVAIGFPQIYRRQALIILAAAFLPWIGNAVYVFGGSPLRGLDIAPIAFSITGLILALGILKLRLFDIVPVARESMIQQIDIGMLVLDHKARIVDSNPAAERIIGRVIEVGRNVEEVLDNWPDKQFLYGGFRERREVLLDERKPSIWLDVDVATLSDRAGRLSGHLITFHDITGRKSVEESLRESETRFRQMVDLLPEAVCEIDNAGNILFANRAAFIMTGYDLSDFKKGLNILPMIAEKDRDRALSNIDSMLKGEVLGADEYTLKRKDGSVFPAMVHISNILNGEGKTMGFRGIVIDITEHKRAEEVRQRLAAIVESSHDAIIGKTLDGIITSWNKGAEARYGYSAEEVIGGPIAVIVPPDRMQEISFLLQTISRGEAVIDYETVRVRKDGSKVMVLLTVSPIKDTYGQIIGASTIAQDVTERRRAEALIRIRLSLLEFAAAHNLEELLQKTLDEVGDLTESPIGFYHFVEKDQKTLSLQAWSTRTIKEFCKAEGRGMHYGIDQAGVWVDCVRERRPVIHNDYRSLPHRKGLPHGHAPIVRELVVPIMRGENIVAILGVGNKPTDYDDKDVEVISYLADVAWEITERKRAEEALKQSEAKFRELAELLPQTVVEVDVEGSFTYVNRYGFEFTGYTREDLEKGMKAIDIFVPEQREMVAENLVRLLRGEDLPSHEYNILKKDGSIFTALIYSNAVVRDGKPSGIRAVVVDISERKRIEQMKTDFVAFISHQLRTPVAGLMGYIDNMLEGITGALNSKQIEYLGEMRDVCMRNNRLIADLLNLSRLERGVLSANMQRVKLRNVVDIAVQDYAKEIEKKGLALGITEVEKDVSVPADSDKLGEVLKNIIHNALKFTRAGSINIEVFSEGGSGIVRIRDTGAGMPEEVMRDLFKKDKVMSGAVAAGGGAGLGLYIAKGFMRLMSGDITVESAVGKGSTFIVKLPMEQDMPQTSIEEVPK